MPQRHLHSFSLCHSDPFPRPTGADSSQMDSMSQKLCSRLLRASHNGKAE